MSDGAAPRRLLMTGAAGRIGTVLRAGLRGAVSEFRLLDVVDLEVEHPSERVIRADVRDLDAICAALDGVDAAIHLAAIPIEAPYADVLAVNVTGTHHVLEGARLGGCARVVLASSNHVTGYYATERRIGPAAPARPDGFYGWSKAASEALGRLYTDRHGLQVVALRIGTFADRPTEQRHLSTWLSPHDAVRLFHRCLVVPGIDHLVVYATSANERGWWDTEGWEQLGYQPRDRAEDHAEAVPQVTQHSPSPFQGGSFAETG